MPRLLLNLDTSVRQGAQQPLANTTFGILSCAFDAERIAAYGAANASFKEHMLLRGAVSIPKIQQLVLMDIAYFNAQHLKWEDKAPAGGHLGGATVRSSDDEAPPPAPASAAAPISSAPEIDFMGWDITDMKSVPWGQLSFSLTGSETMKYADVPQ
jgi:hypothetical protein